MKRNKIITEMTVLLLSVMMFCMPVYSSAEYINMRQARITKKMSAVYPRAGKSKSPQDSFVYGKYFYKFWNPDIVQIYDFKTGKLKAEKKIPGGHCSTVSAEKGKMYVDTNQNPQILQVFKLSGTSIKLEKSLQFPKTKYGYYMKHVADSSGKYVYGLAYKQKYAWSSNANNGMVVSVWDITKLSKNNNGTYTPKLIRTFNVSFFPFFQGMCFHNGNIYVLSSDFISPRTKVFVIDVNRRKYTKSYCNFPDYIKFNESEGIFVDGKYLYIDTGVNVYKTVKIA